MTKEEKNIFWNTLCSLDGKDIVADSKTIRSVIKYPKYLYRYRKVDMNTLGALQRNKMYFSSSNYYDDPFDTFLHVNMDKIKNVAQLISGDIDKRNLYINQLCGLLQMSDRDRLQFISSFDSIDIQKFESIMKNHLTDKEYGVRNEIRKESWSVCFSENGFNEVLWLKYADQHKGFALMYDLEDDSKHLCGKKEKCKKCDIANSGTPLYPMYYSEERYDATDFAQYLVIQKLLDQLPKSTVVESCRSIFGEFTWSREKILLIKKNVMKMIKNGE